MNKRIKNMLFVYLLFVFSNKLLISSENDTTSLWINKEFTNSLKNTKSIYKSLFEKQRDVVIFIKKINSRKYQILQTNDMHDSEIENYSLYKDSNTNYYAMNRKSKKKFIIIDDTTLKYGSYYFGRVLKDNPDIRDINSFLSEQFFTGFYYDSLNSQNIEITPTKFISNSKTLLIYEMGYDFWGIHCDHIAFNLKPGREFERSAYSYTFKNGLLYVYDIIRVQDDEYNQGKKIIFILRKVK